MQSSLITTTTTFFNIILFIILFMIFLYMIYRYSCVDSSSSSSSLSYWSRFEVAELPKRSFIRNLLDYIGDGGDGGNLSKADKCMQLYQQLAPNPYGGLYDYNGRPILMIRDPNLIRSILGKHFDWFYDRDKDLVVERDILSYNIINLTGDKWKHLRKLLHPAFNQFKIAQVFDEIVSLADDFVAAKFTAAVAEDGGEFELNAIFTEFSVNVIGHCVFGIDRFDGHRMRELCAITKQLFRVDGKKKLYIFVKNFCRNTCPNFLKPKRYDNRVTEYFLNLAEYLIERWRQQDVVVTADDQKGSFFIDALLKILNSSEQFEGRNMKDIVAAQLFVFLNAGFEAIANVLIFGIYELSKNQSVQNQLRAEIFEMASENRLTPSILCRMDYLKKVLYEILRLYPAVPKLKRQCTKTDCIVPFGDENIKIEKGTEIFIPVYALQRDANYYQEPDKFDPTLHFPSNNMPDAYFPFGHGRKMCMGMHFAETALKIMLTTLIRNYKFTPSKRTIDRIRFDPYTISIRSKDDIWIRYEKL